MPLRDRQTAKPCQRSSLCRISAKAAASDHPAAGLSSRGAVEDFLDRHAGPFPAPLGRHALRVEQGGFRLSETATEWRKQAWTPNTAPSLNCWR
jgi:hypothetical protein